MARLRVRPKLLRRVLPEDRLSAVEHLQELRNRLVISLAALVLAFIAAYAFNQHLLDILTYPLDDDRQNELLTLSPTEPFVTILKICFYTAIIAALPVWLYQLYAFVIPAVQDQPRRIMLAVVGGVSSLFLAGVAFGYFLVLPVALDFLLGFGDETFNTQRRAGEYFGFATTLLLGSGLIFEVPVAMLALARIGVVTAAQFRKNWRLAIVAIAVLAAVLPGGDPFSMIMLMIPQIILYQLGIILARAFGGPPLWERERWSAGEGGAA
ncbi:MAG: sec-independent protein translocase protein TatC [Miltoncostaeaceae bacterium]|jgi:sec-independent protein translocase protein TatC|nr:sec-independent protein translocase protein TatC [Miltoncostaeaceae bacterium]